MRKPPPAAAKRPKKPTTPRPARQPRIRYTAALAREICRRVAEGADVRALGGAPGMPAWSTVLDWLASNDSFRAAWLDARAGHAELLIDEALALARGVDGATLPETKVKLAELHWQVATRRGGAAIAGRGVDDGGAATAGEKVARVRRALARLDAPALARIMEDRHAPSSKSRGIGVAGSGRRPAAESTDSREGDDDVDDGG